MTRVIRLFLFFEGAAFITAALIHFGVLMGGYEHQKAGTAESVIGMVLLVGWALTWPLPQSIRGIGLTTQGFALFGTLVGLFTIAIGIGPRTAPDLTFHAAIVVALVAGLIVTARSQPGETWSGGETDAPGSRRSAGFS
jgi:hypothetical protein